MGCLTNTNDNYSHLDRNAAEVIFAMTNTRPAKMEEKEGGTFDMGNAIDEIREESMKLGEERGLLTAILNLIRDEGWTFDKAISVLKIPEVDVPYYREKIEKM